jgi:hypothetical protein
MPKYEMRFSIPEDRRIMERPYYQMQKISDAEEGCQQRRSGVQGHGKVRGKVIIANK